MAASSLSSIRSLEQAGESLNHAEIKRKAKQAENDVLSQFHGSETKQHVNAILTITDRALRTTEGEFDPMLELNTILQSDLLAEERRMLQLAGTAVLDVFDTAMRSRREANNAGLGPEDLRFLEALNGLAGPNAEKEIQPQPEIES